MFPYNSNLNLSQNIVQISKNFGVIQLIVYKVNHTMYTLPQVIADSRSPPFESLFKPYKKNNKYQFWINKKGSWEITHLNA